MEDTDDLDPMEHRRQKSQRMVLFAMFVLVLVSGGILQAIERRLIVLDSDRAGWWVVGGSWLLAFVVGLIVALYVRKIFSRVTTLLFGALAGLLSAVVVDPASGLVCGAAAAIAVVVFGDQVVRVVGLSMMILLVAILGGGAAHWTVIMVDRWPAALLGIVFFVTAVLEFALIRRLVRRRAVRSKKSGEEESQLAAGKPRDLMRMLGAFCLVAVGGLTGWHGELWTVMQLSADWAVYEPPMEDPVQLLVEGPRLEAVSLHRPTEIQLRHMSQNRQLEYVQLAMPDHTVDFSHLGHLQWVSSVSVEKPGRKRLAAVGASMPATRLLWIDGRGALPPAWPATAFPNVASVILNSAEISKETMASLARMPKLSNLRLSSCTFEAQDLQLTPLPNVRDLKLSGNEFTPQQLRQLMTWPNLTAIRILNTELTDAELQILAAQPQLKLVEAHVAEITDTTLPILALLDAATSLEVTCSCVNCDCEQRFEQYLSSQQATAPLNGP